MRPVHRASRSSTLGLVVASLLVAVSGFAAAGDETPITEGALRYTDPASGAVRELPLERTDVVASVSGTVAEVTVSQRFSNPLESRLEAVYVFPLPDRAAVDDMSIRIGNRLIRGEIHRREEARQIYDEAVARGHLAGLLDQERPNIFTQRLANLLPGEAVEVVLHYVEDIAYDHGTWRLVFPTVVGPRYIPGAPTGRSGDGWSPDTDQVPDASRITPPVLEPGQRSGHDIAIRVELARARAADPQPLIDEVTALALEHRLMTSYTSFVAVDRSEVRDQGELVTVDQPVPMPEGVSYEGVFGAPGGRAMAKMATSRVAGVVRQPAPGTTRYAAGSRERLEDAVRMQLPMSRVPIPDPSPSRQTVERERPSGRPAVTPPQQPVAINEARPRLPAEEHAARTVVLRPPEVRSARSDSAGREGAPASPEVAVPRRTASRRAPLLVHLPSLILASVVLLVALVAWALRSRVAPA